MTLQQLYQIEKMLNRISLRSGQTRSQGRRGARQARRERAAGAAYLRYVSRQRWEQRSMARWIGGQCERV